MPPITMKDRLAEARGKSAEEAKFYWSGGPIEVAARTYFQSQFSGVTGFDTDDGVVLVDSGIERLGATLNALLRQKTSSPIHTAIFTQGHVDHAYGLKHFLVPGQPTPRVVAHRAMPSRFARYALTRGYNAAINARQFGGTAEWAEAKPETFRDFGPPSIPPDTLYDERIDLTVGGVSFEVHHCRGETDDHTWVFCPDRGVLCPGDLFIWAVPNAGNPQKVQRYPWDWARGLRLMAGKEPETMCPGHGAPVVRDRTLIRRMLLETADFLDVIVERTIASLNKGAPPHADIVHAVELPRSDSPWLQPVYDDTEFIVRSIIRFYGGWWNGRPSELKPAPRDALAREIAALAGGVDRLLARALELLQKGELRLACHLADSALEAAPGQPEVRESVAAIYELRAALEPSLMGQNLCHSAAAYARKGRPFV